MPTIFIPVKYIRYPFLKKIVGTYVLNMLKQTFYLISSTNLKRIIGFLLVIMQHINIFKAFVFRRKVFYNQFS